MNFFSQLLSLIDVLKAFLAPPPHPFIEIGILHTFLRSIVRYKCLHVTIHLQGFNQTSPPKKINKFPNTSTWQSPVWHVKCKSISVLKQCFKEVLTLTSKF